MKLREITAADVAAYLRLDPDQSCEKQLAPVMEAAKRYIVSYTGLTTEELDDYDDLWLAFMVLCQDTASHECPTTTTPPFSTRGNAFSPPPRRGGTTVRAP